MIQRHSSLSPTPASRLVRHPKGVLDAGGAESDGGPSSRCITPRKFSRGVIVTVAYSFTPPDSLISWARTARRIARFTTARFTTARLTARRFTAFLTTRRFTTARLTARLFTAFLTTAPLHGTLHGALLHGASCHRSLHCFLRQVALLKPSQLRCEAGWRRRRHKMLGLFVSSADILVHLRDLSRYLFRIAVENLRRDRKE